MEEENEIMGDAEAMGQGSDDDKPLTPEELAALANKELRHE